MRVQVVESSNGSKGWKRLPSALMNIKGRRTRYGHRNVSMKTTKGRARGERHETSSTSMCGATRRCGHKALMIDKKERRGQEGVEVCTRSKDK